MNSSSIPFGLGLAGIGAVLVSSGITGNSLSQILQGNFTRTTAPQITAAGQPITTANGVSQIPYNAAPGGIIGAVQAGSKTAKSPTTFSSAIPTYPSLANKSMTWLLANGYTKNANGQVVSTK